MDILSLLPKAYFPERVFFGDKSSLFFKSIAVEKKLFLLSKSFYENNQELLKPLNISEETLILHSGEPSRDDIEDVQKKCQELSPQWIVAVGGGSIIDLAKVVKRNLKLKLVAVPTTLGSGTEISQHVVYIQNGAKKVESSHEFLPEVVLLDPRYLSTLSREQTIFQAIDALAHAVESAVSKMANPFSDAVALQGLEKIFTGLEMISQKQETPTVAELQELQLGAFFAGLAQSSAATGLAHSFAHCIGPRSNIPHAQAVASFLLEVVTLNEAHTDKYNKLDSVSALKDKNIVDVFTQLFSALNIQSVQLPKDIDVEELANAVRKDICTMTNPYPPTTEEISQILRNHA